MVFFIPSFGYILLILGAGAFLVNNWERAKETGLGDKRVWVPLAVIVAGMGLSGAVNGETLQDKVSPLFMGMALFAVYLSARVLGEDMLRMIAPFVVIGSISVIVNGLINPGQYTGGFITNYCAAAGYLIFGVLVYQGSWRLALMLLAGVGLFFIGALEAVFIVGVLGLVVLLRRDRSKQLVFVGLAILILIGIWAGLGYLVPLYEGNQNLAVLHSLITGGTAFNADTMTNLTSGRWLPIVEAVRNFSFIGQGYSLSTVGGGVVHNMPLIIMQQIGPFAALAWLFVSIFCLVKTKWKYAWVAVLAMGVWDHYLWTQMGPWWWALVGVTTASSLQSDLLFRRKLA